MFSWQLTARLAERSREGSTSFTAELSASDTSRAVSSFHPRPLPPPQIILMLQSFQFVKFSAWPHTDAADRHFKKCIHSTDIMWDDFGSSPLMTSYTASEVEVHKFQIIPPSPLWMYCVSCLYKCVQGLVLSYFEYHQNDWHVLSTCEHSTYTEVCFVLLTFHRHNKEVFRHWSTETCFNYTPPFIHLCHAAC